MILMKTMDTNASLVEGYIRLLENLSLSSKIDLISKLTLSVKQDVSGKKKFFYKAFGAWKSKETADEIINEIINSRTFKRQIIRF